MPRQPLEDKPGLPPYGQRSSERRRAQNREAQRLLRERRQIQEAETAARLKQQEEEIAGLRLLVEELRAENARLRDGQTSSSSVNMSGFANSSHMPSSSSYTPPANAFSSLGSGTTSYLFHPAGFTDISHSASAVSSRAPSPPQNSGHPGPHAHANLLASFESPSPLPQATNVAHVPASLPTSSAYRPPTFFPLPNIPTSLSNQPPARDSPEAATEDGARSTRPAGTCAQEQGRMLFLADAVAQSLAQSRGEYAAALHHQQQQHHNVLHGYSSPYPSHVGRQQPASTAMSRHSSASSSTASSPHSISHSAFPPSPPPHSASASESANGHNMSPPPQQQGERRPLSISASASDPTPGFMTAFHSPIAYGVSGDSRVVEKDRVLHGSNQGGLWAGTGNFPWSSSNVQPTISSGI